MEILIALLVALGIVTSDDAQTARFSNDEIRVMAEKGGVTEEKLADYEKSIADEQKKEEEHIGEDESDF
jgi:hypothetical protein